MEKININALDKKLFAMSAWDIEYYYSCGWSIYWVQIRSRGVTLTAPELYRSEDRLPYESVTAVLEARNSDIEVLQIVERRQWKKN